MTTISSAGYANIEPRLITGYEASRRTRTIVHPSASPTSPAPYISFATAALRTGTLEVLFDDQTAALECFNRHALPLTFTFHEPQRHSMAMRYVVAEGELTITLDDDTRALWFVRIPFQEVP